MKRTGMRARWAARRVRPGDGSPLPPFRWWQLLSRSLFTVTLPLPGGGGADYAVDVRQLGDRDDGAVRARLYRDGAQAAVSKVPARFPVPGGEIHVVIGSFGVKRCHLVSADHEEQLRPHPRSAVGRRANLERTYPRVSQVVGLVATCLMIAGLCIAVPQIVEPISRIPAIAENLGTFDFPVDLPAWATVALAVASLLGSAERALRMRSSWLDDLAN